MDGRQIIPLLLMVCFSVCNCNIPIERISDSGANETNGEKGIWDWLTGGGDKKSICDERCGLPYISKDDDDDRVVGGMETKPNQFPWMAFLQIKKSDFFKESISYCGATLIKKQFLLTAAHCVYASGLKSIDALLGFHYLKTSRYRPTGYEKILSVTKVYIHEDFDPERMENDLAILELAKPINLTDQIHTICLADEKMKKLVEGTELTLSGWGGTVAFGTTFYPKMLLSTTMKVVDKKKCREAFGPDDSKYILKSSICAGGSTNNSCFGDSGGPLMLPKAQGKLGKRFIQVGVVSFGGDDECDTSLPGVYSRISKQLSWIQKITERKDPCKPITFN